MSDRKFVCPVCGQKIQCDESMGGMQIKCPVCQAEIIIPEAPQPTQPAAAPPAPTGVRLSVARHQPAAPTHTPAAPVAPQRPAPAPPPPPPPPGPAARRLIMGEEEPKEGRTKQILTIAGVVALVGVILYFAFPAIMSMQKNVNAAREKDLEERGSGEVGHIAELNNVLDATDPARFEKMAASSPRPAAPRPTIDTTPVVPPSWTLDAAVASIPDGRANGTIAGATFVADAVRLDPVGDRHLLTLRQGSKLYADRELLIYLKLKPGEGLEGRTWTISADTRTGAPQILKRWLIDPNRPPQAKPFVSGYVMKLELGAAKNGVLPGKLFVALPDPEKTVVGGAFKAVIGVPLDAAAARRDSEF